jgi:hypothetical protein
MRAAIVILVLVVIFGLVGWVKFGSPNGDPTIQLDSDKIKQDTSEIVEKTKEVVEQTSSKIDSTFDDENAEPLSLPQ